MNVRVWKGKIEKGGVGATYLPSRKPFSHTLDDVLGIRGDNPRRFFISIYPHPELPIVTPLLASALAIPITIVESVDRNHILEPLERSQQFRPLAGSPSPGIDLVIHGQRTLPPILCPAGESDTGGSRRRHSPADGKRHR